MALEAILKVQFFIIIIIIFFNHYYEFFYYEFLSWGPEFSLGTEFSLDQSRAKFSFQNVHLTICDNASIFRTINPQWISLV